MHNLILIERDSALYGSWRGLERKKRIPDLSAKEIVDVYQGFEGKIICYYKYKKDFHKLSFDLEELIKYKEIGSCFILHILSGSTVMSIPVQDLAIKVGYDVGFCECEEDAIYSSIFHEILFGYFDELAIYANKLNKYFLFPNRDIAEKYVMTHDEMSAQGKGVEDIVPMQIYEVWKHRIDN